MRRWRRIPSWATKWAQFVNVGSCLSSSSSLPPQHHPNLSPNLKARKISKETVFFFFTINYRHTSAGGLPPPFPVNPSKQVKVKRIFLKASNPFLLNKNSLHLNIRKKSEIHIHKHAQKLFAFYPKLKRRG